MPAFTENELERAYDYGTGFFSWPFPLAEEDLTPEWYAHNWGSFLAGPEALASEYYISDHVDQAKAVMIEQFKRKPNINTFVEILAGRIQGLENMFDDLLTDRLISTAIGDNLDEIGLIVDESRLGKSDDDYRIAILFKIFINISSGQPETIITVIKRITEATQVRLLEFFPAAMYIFTDGTIIPEDLGTTMKLVAPAGVRFQIASSFGEIPFEFDTEGGIPYSEGDGFSELNYTEGGLPIGGNMVELVYGGN